MDTTDFDHLLFLAGTETGLQHLKELLCRPDLGLWRNHTLETCAKRYDVLKASLKKNILLSNFLDLHLFTEGLVYRRECADWFLSWVRDSVGWERFFPDVPWDNLLQSKWLAVPVILVQDKSYLRYFVIGVSDAFPSEWSWPSWAENLMDPVTREAIKRAEEACRDLYPPPDGRSLVSFPLTMDNRKIQFTGDSLGLPIALGFMSLLRGKPLPDDLAATGSVAKDGSVELIGQLHEKMNHARKCGFKVFLFPAENRFTEKTVSQELLPVKDLKSAWMFSRLYAPGNASELLMLEKMIEDPDFFIRNCHHVPRQWLTWAREQGLSRRVGKAVATSPAMFQGFVKALETCFENGNLQMGEEIARIVDAAVVERANQNTSNALFRWHTLNLAMANHRGDTKSADIWQKKAETMIKNAAVKDVEAFAAYCNYTFIGLHHNRYQFSPELPPFLKHIVKPLKEQYDARCQIIPHAVSVTLGALYGSIAQNYGFCGPEYLDQTRKYCALSKKAFGDGADEHLKGDCFRAINYQFYAEMGAGRQARAEKSILAYLELTGWQKLFDGISKFSQWQHAALARFFENVFNRPEAVEYEIWARKNKSVLMETKHPWQLWLNNLGRISRKLGRDDDAYEFFTDSLSMCLSKRMGPTVRVMGLMPLSGLKQLPEWEAFDELTVEKQIRNAAEELNKKHFADFLNKRDLNEILDVLWFQPEVLFPFTYR